MSEYDPVFARKLEPADEVDLETVRLALRRAAAPYLRSPLPWLVWALVLPGTALATPTFLSLGGLRPVILLWSVAILLAGLFEMLLHRREKGGRAKSPLAGWIMRSQGNLSAVVLILSLLLIWRGLGWYLPGVWLLLLGHSLYAFGRLLLPALRTAGVLYQIGGVVSLAAGERSLLAFALTLLVANSWVAVGIWRQRARSD